MIELKFIAASVADLVAQLKATAAAMAPAQAPAAKTTVKATPEPETAAEEPKKAPAKAKKEAPKPAAKLTAAEMKEKRRLAGLKGLETRKKNEAERKAKADAQKAKQVADKAADKAASEKAAATPVEEATEAHEAVETVKEAPVEPKKANGSQAAAEDAPEPKHLTYDNYLKPAVLAAVNANGKDAVKVVMRDYEIANANELDRSQWRMFVTDLEALADG